MQRRQFIKTAAGISFYLPLLEGLLTPQELKAASDPQSFMIIFKQNCGIGDAFWQKNAGPLSQASMAGTATELISDYASKLLLVKGFEHPVTKNQGGCSHAEGNAQLLTAGQVSGSSYAAAAHSPSLDWVAAQQLQKKEPLYLMAAERIPGVQDRLSWKGNKQGFSATQNPYTAYVKLFGSAVPPVTGTASDPTDLIRKSVNDLVKAQLKAIQANSRLSREDRDRLDLHLSSIRDLEKSMVSLSLPTEKIAAIKATEKFNDANYKYNQQDIAKLHIDIVTIAAATGQSRVSNVQMGMGLDHNVYKIDGKVQSTSWHEITHIESPSAGVGYKLRNLHDKMFAQVYKYLLDKLSERTYGNKTLLDFGCALWLNDMGFGDHTLSNLPHVVAGSCNGILAQGKMIDVGKKKNNLFLSTIGSAIGLKNAAGEALNDFNASSADQKGIVKEMLA